MPIENPITYEQAKEHLQAMRHNIKLELFKYSEKHLPPMESDAKKELRYIGDLVDEFAQASYVRMVKLIVQTMQEDKPLSGKEHIALMINRVAKRFGNQ